MLLDLGHEIQSIFQIYFSFISDQLGLVFVFRFQLSITFAYPSNKNSNVQISHSNNRSIAYILLCALHLSLDILGALAGLHWLGTCLFGAPDLVAWSSFGSLGPPPLILGRLPQPTCSFKYLNFSY